MENYKLISFILSGAVFTIYWLYIYYRYGIQKSISDSYYKLKDKGYLFTLVLWSFSIPIMIIGETGLMFFAGAFICFTGAAADFKKKMTDTVHYVGAVGGILFGLLSLSVNFGQNEIAALTIVGMALLTLFKVSNKTWWVETVAFLGIYLGLLISNL